MGNGQALPINHIGNTTLPTKYHNFILKDVLHVPRIAMNLLSVHKFCLHNNCSCHFDANELKIQDIPTGRLLYRGLSKNGVYPIYSRNFLKPTTFQSASVSPSPQSAKSWCLLTPWFWGGMLEIRCKWWRQSTNLRTKRKMKSNGYFSNGNLNRLKTVSCG